MQSAARLSMLDQKASAQPGSAGPSLVGQTINHYRILQKLGAGGMGVVYQAFDCKLERTVALKFLPEHLTVSAGEKTSLRREARAASTLDDPHIGVIHGLEETADHQLFIVMQ
ncbi:MAG TPA: hypothetical protein VKB24_04050, partial [Candidatus Acidoferrum sp.]|nr:hypothetical protein [Candidatus Acidoferrum sp.]